MVPLGRLVPSPRSRRGAIRLASPPLHIPALLTAAVLLSACGGGSSRQAVREVDLTGAWEFRQVGDTAWLPATVPGTVHTDLLDAGLVPDPFYGDNEHRLQWIEEEEWEYRKRFRVDPALLEMEGVELHFEGLDTYAEVSLNGREVLRADNMFREWVVPVRDALVEGENTLQILFRSPIRTAAPLFDALPYRLPAGNDRGEKPVRVFTRKAAYHYGWDWGPRFVTSGVWRPAKLRGWSGGRIQDVFVIQGSLDDERAELTVLVAVEGASEGAGTLRVESPGGDFTPVQVPIRLAPGINLTRVPLTVDDPELWWPNGLGEARLYEVEIALDVEGGPPPAGSAGSDPEPPARFTDRRSLRIGLRTVELVTEPDSIGESFHFRVNGVPVFMKGANIIPLDHFSPRVGEAEYRRLFRSAAEAHMNMLRVWGGGIYETDLFYDLADEHGILIWQDFMFANGMFPGDSAFLANVREEAKDQLRRLRNHPSVALWCGNNEIDEGWHNWGWQRQLGYTAADSAEIWSNYEEIFHRILPGVVEEMDPARRYWPSSPSIGWGHPESLTRGDSHYWGVWHGGEPFRVFQEKLPRFSSEYGFQAYPPLRTIDAFTAPEEMSPDSPVMLVHQKHGRGNELIREYMARWYPVPEDFGDFVYLSQLLQAQGMRMAFEAHRRARPRTMGTLYWQLNDTWPVVSWSGLDYFGRWKALHYAAREAFAPVLLSPVIRGDSLEVWVVSDKLESIDARLEVVGWSLAGEELARVATPVRVRGNRSEQVLAGPMGPLVPGLESTAVAIEARLLVDGPEGPQVLAEGHVYPAPPRELELEDPEVRVSVEASGGDGGYRIEVSSARVARNVQLWFPLAVEAPGEAHFSHNFFDLMPGRTRVVDLRVDVPAGQAPSVDQVRGSLRIRSLVDAIRPRRPPEPG